MTSLIYCNILVLQHLMFNYLMLAVAIRSMVKGQFNNLCADFLARFKKTIHPRLIRTSVTIHFIKTYAKIPVVRIDKEEICLHLLSC